MESKVFVKDPEGCTLKKGQDWVSEENVIDSMGIGVRKDHNQHIPKSYIFHSNLHKIRAVLNNCKNTTCSYSCIFIGTGNILNFLRKIF